MPERIKEFCEEYGYEYRDDYSGRFMYGSRCVGIVSEEASLFTVLIQLTEYLKDNEIDDIPNKIGVPKTDSMGIGAIIYFPKIHM